MYSGAFPGTQVLLARNCHFMPSFIFLVYFARLGVPRSPYLLCPIPQTVELEMAPVHSDHVGLSCIKDTVGAPQEKIDMSPLPAASLSPLPGESEGLLQPGWPTVHSPFLVYSRLPGAPPRWELHFPVTPEAK